MFVFFLCVLSFNEKGSKFLQQCIESYLLLVFCDRFT